ncbi:hypothetical protein F4553_005809 [Allocatelliglobosispora scoriae]|uniref:Uncharacterized protein n=1 Tax=Allocatelliglobosispora scoriae TaxID=643052 RepID=A0A841BXI3_9ACTN|nr:hypothetical protein [Allocatelliglobosispora scoriae]MBB5872375.1 hypothetical protein [Allocatelliglobosispora scoriae]
MIALFPGKWPLTRTARGQLPGNNAITHCAAQVSDARPAMRGNARIAPGRISHGHAAQHKIALLPGNNPLTPTAKGQLPGNNAIMHTSHPHAAQVSDARPAMRGNTRIAPGPISYGHAAQRKIALLPGNNPLTPPRRASFRETTRSRTRRRRQPRSTVG